MKTIIMKINLPHVSLLKRLIAGTGLLLFGVVSNSGAATALNIPPALTGPVYNLDMQNGTTQLLDGAATPTSGYNGSILGPTLIMNSGDFVTLNVTNNLGEETTTHWHGMHVSPDDDGGPHTVIGIGETWSPDFTVLDTASTMWYHPHLHGNTHDQVNSGLAGMILVRDDVETAADLPRTYGVDEFPVIIQDKEFAANNTLRRVNFGDVIMVNATIDPFLEVPSQMVRLRLLNGSADRAYHLGFSDNRNYSVVGADGGLLEAPVSQNRTILMPGERLDVVVDFSSDNGSTLQLMSYSSTLPGGVPGGPGGGGNLLNGTDFNILELRVVAQAGTPITTLPTGIWTIPDRPIEADATVTRTIRLTRNGAFSIDDQEFDGSRMDQVVLLDSVEVWSIVNEAGGSHPFHIHDIQFFILDRNGNPPTGHETGKKDTVRVDNNETVRFITKFETHANTEVPYMYHCHILPHEDGGMMAQFIVVDPASQLLDMTPSATDLTLRWSKNLSTDVFSLQSTAAIESTFTNLTATPSLVDDKNQVIVDMDTDNHFFRLLPVTGE